MPFDLQAFLGVSGVHIPEHGPEGARGVCFASGANQVADIRAFAALGIPPGLAACNVVGVKGDFSEAVPELDLLAGTGLPVFMDSGEYNAFRQGEDISPEGWVNRFSLYDHLATTLGPQLYAVAPDRIMDQKTTLDLLTRYANDVRRIAGLGAQILLPMQSGELPLGEFMDLVISLLGVPVIPAFPMRKIEDKTHPRNKERMTRTEDLVAFIEAYQPEKIHLLGIGAKGHGLSAILDAIWAAKPDLLINQDAQLLKSRMGNADSPRKFDEAWEASFAMVQGVCFEDESAWDAHWKFTDEISDLTSWMTPSQRVRVGLSGGELNHEEFDAFVDNPTEFMEAMGEVVDEDGVSRAFDLWSDYALGHAIDCAWHDYVATLTASRRRAWAIYDAFKDHPAVGQFPCACEWLKREIEAQDPRLIEEWREAMEGLGLTISGLKQKKNRDDERERVWVKERLKAMKEQKAAAKASKSKSRRPEPIEPEPEVVDLTPYQGSLFALEATAC